MKERDLVKDPRNSRFYIRLPLLLAAAIAGGILIGATIVDNKTTTSSVFSSVLKFREILTHIEKDYVDQVDTDELVEGAIRDMLKKLDPHTIYIPAEDRELTKSELEGGFDGIGIEFSIIRDTITVVAPLSGGPSEKLGLKTGDKIIEVDNEPVAGIGINNRGVFKRLRGPKGSEVKVGVRRRNVQEVLVFNIIRDKIPQKSVDVSYMVNDEIGYLKISRFAATTYDEFKIEIEKLSEQGMKKLILDLQGNPGGYMDRAVDIADEFLSEDKLIVYTKGKESRYDSEARAQRTGVFEKGPIIVLIDQGSASASEIVSGALQDNDRALIVGRRSFGKGLVQRPIVLSDGSELRLVISRYYIPSGRSVQKPYDDGSDYDQELYDRYTNGELFNADSAWVNEDLTFKTAKGRTVYGGGGVMPDIFVPVDTSKNSRYLSTLFTSNAIGEFTLGYYEENRRKLEELDYQDFKRDFVVTDEMLEALIQTGAEVDVPFDEVQFEHSKDLLRTHLKAQIARRVWDNPGFYPIFNQSNEVFLQALELFDEAEALAQK